MSCQPKDVCVTALGMATALAPNLPDSWAAFRAGINRVSHLETITPDFDEALGEEPIAAYRAAYLAEGYCSGAKAVLLGRLALCDLVQRATLRKDDWQRTGIVVYLSDWGLLGEISAPFDGDADGSETPSELWQEDYAKLIPRMLAASGISISEDNRHILFGAHAGFVDALQLAANLVAGRKLDRCLVGAVDSTLDPEFLIAAAVKGLLKTPLNPVGFVPGEAAAFALVERTRDARPGRPPLASFSCGPLVPGEFDSRSQKSPDGDRLARAIRNLFDAWPLNTEVAVVIGDLNGDEYRARNWGSALTRLVGHNAGRASIWIPALGFGEMGAATGAVGLCLATRAVELGRVPQASVLTWLTDESGAAAAMMIMPVIGGVRG